jgi:uncharacterized protein (DUF983 family)
MSQESAFKAALASKCPQCRKGEIFKHPLSKLSKFARMHKECSQCSLRYEVEPGFFVGAMYFSYGVTVALLIAVGIVHHFLGINGLYKYITSVVLINALLLPFIFRYSRIAFLYMFGGVKYNGE